MNGIQPTKILREAIRAVPAVKYALGVAGIVAVVAIVQAFRLDLKVAVFGTIVMFTFMVLLVVFAKLTTIAPKYILLPVLVTMWAFLVLAIASACLLFSTTFFGIPKGFHDLLFGKKAGIAVPSTPADPRLIKAAQMQSIAGDCEGGWKQIEQFLKEHPNSEEGRKVEIEIAMEWLRNIRVLRPRTMSEVVDQVLPCLYQGAAKAKGTQAADIHAHIGWGNYLKYNEGIRGLDIEAQFKEALKLDPQNPYGHAMWAVWTLQHDLKDAKEHFAAAFRSGRDQQSVRKLQLGALLGCHEMDCDLEKIRVANEMRQKGEVLHSEPRGRIMDAYYPFTPEIIEGLRSILSPADHLATYAWLAEGSDDNSMLHRLWLARLTEETGDFSKALSIYRSVRSDPEFNRFTIQEEIKNGITRCSQKAPQSRGELQLQLEGAKHKDPVQRERAVRGLPRVADDGKDILPAITAATHDENRNVRTAAWEALAEVGPPAVPALIELLASHEERDVLNAATVLSMAGTNAEAAVPSLINALQNQNEKVRSKAASALGSIGPGAATAVPALLEVLKQNDSAETQQAAAYAIGEMGSMAGAAVPALIKMLQTTNDPWGFVNDTAAEALGKIGDPASIPALIEALKSDHVRLPTIATDALGNIGAEAKAAIPALIELMKSDKEHQMNQAEVLGKIAQALMTKGDTQSIPQLRQILRALEEGNLELRVISPVRDALDLLREREQARK